MIVQAQVRSARLLAFGIAAFFSAVPAAPVFAGSETQPVPAIFQPAETAHVDIYKKLAPAVVGIICKGKMPNGMPGAFYGTGEVISADGLILTDVTVIPQDATEIKIYFTDGKILPAEMKTFDAKSEGVLLKADGKSLPYMKLADTTKCAVGQPVYSWGNPHASIQRDGMVSLSTGAISGIYDLSSVDDQSRYIGPVIETDAAVNPGSDGGALTDADGNLVGIMSLGFSRTRWLGVAIPIARLAEGLPDLKKLPMTNPPVLTGARADVWAERIAFAELHASAAQSTVAVWPVLEGDAPAPEKRGGDELKALDPFPEGEIRAALEARRPINSAGSGFIIDSDGTVLTSAALLAGKLKTVYVYLPDGSRAEAKVLGTDEFYDTAVLKFEATPAMKLKAVEWSAAKLAQAGMVAVLGRSEPPGRITLNAGTVSGAGRYENTCLQISALIDYGNLGGPVIDLSGRVAGMAVHLNDKTPWRQNCGVGFMLTADRLKQIITDLKTGKKTEHPLRPLLGVQADNLGGDFKGAHVKDAPATGPAGAAGIQKGDTIIGFEAKPIDDWNALLLALHDKKPGELVKVKIKRAEKEMVFDVKLGTKEQ
jgi:S1-C subfamily serine protease